MPDKENFDPNFEDLGVPDSSRVTTFQLYQAIVAVKTEQRLQRALMESIVERQKDHEVRIRSTERWKYSVPVAAMVSFAAVVGALTRGGL